MHERVEYFDALLDIGDRLESGIDHVDHHDLHLLDGRAELVVVLVPRGGLHVQYGLLHFAQIEQVAIERGLDLAQIANDLGALLAAEYRQLLLLAVLVVGEMHLTIAYLHVETKTDLVYHLQLLVYT